MTIFFGDTSNTFRSLDKLATVTVRLDPGQESLQTKTPLVICNN